MYLGLTGARIKAGDSLYAGVATHFVPQERLERLRKALTETENVDEAIASCSKRIDAETLTFHRGAIDRFFLQNSPEDVLANLRAEPSEWAARQAEVIAGKSPTSLKICHRQLREGLTLDFNACMRLEYRIVNRIFTGHDFFEGTRAVVIDKDMKPVWRPADLQSVSRTEIDAYFEPLEEELPL
jgi:enoyl-CoA hydratase